MGSGDGRADAAQARIGGSIHTPRSLRGRPAVGAWGGDGAGCAASSAESGRISNRPTCASAAARQWAGGVSPGQAFAFAERAANDVLRGRPGAPVGAGRGRRRISQPGRGQALGARSRAVDREGGCGAGAAPERTAVSADGFDGGICGGGGCACGCGAFECRRGTASAGSVGRECCPVHGAHAVSAHHRSPPDLGQRGRQDLAPAIGGSASAWRVPAWVRRRTGLLK